MTYTPQTWADNDSSKPLSAARLQHIEDGIVAVDSAVATKLDGSTLAPVATAGTYASLTGKPAIPATAADLGAVPTTRTVAGKALSGDITLAHSDLTGQVSLAQMAPGGTFYVYKNGANWVFPGQAGSTITARPTSRTDLTMETFSTDGTQPSFAIAGLDIANTVPA